MNSHSIAQWAQSQGLHYERRAEGAGRLPWRGLPFPPHGRYSLEHHLVSPFGVEMGTLSVRAEEDGTNSMFAPFSFVSFPLPTQVPHLVVTNRRSPVLAKTGFAFSRGQKLAGSLEFDKIFQLHCPQEYERDALYVFTPDLLALLIDIAPGAEIELVDRTVYLYLPEPPDISTPDAAQVLVDEINALKAKLARQTARYADMRVASGAGPALPGSNVAMKGFRLQQKMSTRFKIIIFGSWALALPAIVGLYWFANNQ